ncbi:MAG: hypothetical protein M1834_002267 [Cirrosporium novae-zelandiae]|nr:MAG: hypothetical protein M1834_002267 [Cirrosporium novae-zelandiae]
MADRFSKARSIDDPAFEINQVPSTLNTTSVIHQNLTPSDPQQKEVEDKQKNHDPESLMFEAHPPKKSWKFILIFAALCVTIFLVALDASVVTTALPTITRKLDSNAQYVWIINAYLLASTAVQPLFGQMANILGRRILIIISIILFAVGSLISGAASKTTMLVAGRTIQGVGGGGISTLVEVVVSDLVSLRERGKWISIIGSMWTLGSVTGPVLGGALAQASWRWVFYINIPFAAIALVLIILFLRLKHDRVSSIREKILRIDIVGNFILISSVIAILLALSWGGIIYQWSSWRTIMPIIAGAVGICIFLIFQSSPYCKEPTMPLRIFTNRTSAATLSISFLQSVVLYWAILMLPIYFQAVLEASPAKSGIMLFPLVISSSPAGIIAGILISKTGHYRIFHFLGFGLMTLSTGLFSLVTNHSPTVLWIIFQLIFGIGSGVIFTSCLPPILASLPASDTAVGVATWAFLRSFGSVFGIAIPSTIFNFHVNSLLGLVDDTPTRALLANGGAYQHASAKFLKSLSNRPVLQDEVFHVYIDSLHLVWLVSIAFAGLGIPLALFVEGLKLSSDVQSDFGLDDHKPQVDQRCLDHNAECL